MNAIVRWFGRRRERGRRTWGQRFVIWANLVAIVGALGLAWMLNFTFEQAASIERIQLGANLTPLGESDDSGGRVFNLLIVGYDSSAGLDPDDPIQVGRNGERFSDVIIVAHIDEVDETVTLLSVPRDLWLPIAGLDREQKINYAFGVGGPAVLIDTIEAELDIPIHHFVSVDFAGFQGIVEVVGTVDVYFDQPARDWNASPASGPAFSQTGFEMLEPGCQPLDPPTALAYVRSRYYQVQSPDGTWVDSNPPSDLGRMIRQQDFVRRLLAEAIDSGARNPFVLADLIDAGLENVTIDQELTPQVLVDVGRTFRNFEPGQLQTYSFPVQFGWEGTASVLYGIEDEADPILRILRGESPTDPRTVLVSVVGDQRAEEESALLATQLSDAGFDVNGASQADVAPGLTIRHGANGRQAAELVSEVLNGAGRLEEIDALSGRSVIVVVGGSAAAELTESSTTSSPPTSATSVPSTEPATSETTSQADGAGGAEQEDDDAAAAADECG